MKSFALGAALCIGWASSAAAGTAAASAAAATGGGPTQRLREFSTARQHQGETQLAARLEYAAGALRLQPAGGAMLYRMRLAYDEARFAPRSDFDTAAGSVLLGVKATGSGGIRVSSREHLRQTAIVELSPRVQLSVDLTLGAAEADLEFGGLQVTDLRLKTGASKTVVHFSHLNPGRCRRAVFTVGAAEFAALGLGNSRCDDVRFEGGVGKVTLDFSGSWPSDMRTAITMAVGDLTLRLPRHVGVRVMVDKFLSTFEPAGLTRRGTTYLSPGYTRATRHLDIELTTAMGGVAVEWVN